MVSICIEALIRLFFEIIRVLFGDVTLIGESYLDTQLPALLSTLKWILLFTILSMLVRNQVLKKILIVGIPAVFGSLIDLLGLIPFVGGFLSVGVGIAGIPIAVLAWCFVLWVDDRVHPLLRVFATPGIMICAAINAVQPVSIAGDLGFALAVGYMPELMAFLSLIVISVIIIISPTFLCSALNKVLILWESIRYEGWKAAILGCLVVIKNKRINFR